MNPGLKGTAEGRIPVRRGGIWTVEYVKYNDRCLNDKTLAEAWCKSERFSDGRIYKYPVIKNVQCDDSCRSGACVTTSEPSPEPPTPSPPTPEKLLVPPVPGTKTVIVPLKWMGWHLISTPLDVEIFENALGTCEGKVKRGPFELVKSGGDISWRKVSNLNPLQGYYLKVSEPCRLRFTTTDHDRTKLKLSPGWELISSSKSWNDIKNECVIDRDAIYKLGVDSQGNYVWDVLSPNARLNDAKGYFVFVESSCTIAE